MNDDILDNVAYLPLELGDLIAVRHLDGAREYVRFIAGCGEDVLVTQLDMSECFYPACMIDVSATVAALGG